MDFAQHLISYYKGEWMEAVLLTAFGITCTFGAVVMWQHADQNAMLKGFFYPIAFLAALTVLTGSFGVYNNSQRLATMPAQYAQSPPEFVQAERNRFDGTNGVNTWWMPWAMSLRVINDTAMPAMTRTAHNTFNGIHQVLTPLVPSKRLRSA